MNVKDIVIQQHRATIMMPKFEDIEPLQTGFTRFIMAEDGLWIESEPVWGHLCLPLWKSPVPLPYGQVIRDVTIDFPPLPQCIKDEIKRDALRWAGYEYAGCITVDENHDMQYREIEGEHVHERSYGSISYDRPERVLLDIHSHGYGSAYFSSVDNHDDAGGVYIAMVLGNCKGDGSQMSYVARLCVEGFFFTEDDAPEIKMWLNAAK